MTKIKPIFTLCAIIGTIDMSTTCAATNAGPQDIAANAPLVWYRLEMDRVAPSNSATPSAAGPDVNVVKDSDPAIAAIHRTDTSPYDAWIRNTADELGLDEGLLHAVIHVESRYNARAVSPKGAIGLMQVMPATGQRFGFSNLMDPQVNLRAGATYLKWLLEHFNNDLELAVAAYNAGEGSVHKYGRTIPPYQETQDFVRQVLSRYRGDTQAFPQKRVAAAPPAPSPLQTTRPASSQTSTLVILRKLAGLLLSAPDP